MIHLLLNFWCQTSCCRGLSEKWRSLSFEFVNCNQAMGYSGGGQKCRSADQPEGLPASPPFRWPLPCSPALTILSTTLMVYDSSCSVKVVHATFVSYLHNISIACPPQPAGSLSTLIYLLLIAPSQRPVTSIVTSLCTLQCSVVNNQNICIGFYNLNLKCSLFRLRLGVIKVHKV